MANQPKKYKKFVVTAATATLVASAIAPVAFAADFKDVPSSNTHADAINALSAEGIINGYADGTFKPDQSITRGQVVKLLGRWLEAQGQEIPADWDSEKRFNDLAVNNADAELVKYAALAKDAGVFNGSNGNLNAANNITREQMAVVLVRAIKQINGVDLVADYKDAGFKSSVSDLDKAYSSEQTDAIKALEFAELTTVTNFRPTENLTRGQFASFLYRTINLDIEVAVDASVKAINNTTVEVTFKDEVEDVKALDFAIDGLEISNAAVKQTNKKVVVLTTSAQTADTEYTVTLDGEKIGSFKGVSAVIPTKVELVEQSIQGKLGQQVTVKAQVTVAEGQTKAGIPVTFFIPGSANGVKAPVTVEAVTNEEGIATYSYTRYAATNDTVTVYANGDRSKFSTGYVFWAVDQTLTITEVTEGTTINNGANKTYKVTYKHPETGKPVSGKVLNVSVKENIDVTVDKLQNVTVNGVAVVQTSDNNTKAAQITTDSKGEATFTVSGSNAEVTPVVFDATSTNVTNVYAQKYTSDTLQASATKVTFGAIQSAYTLELTRDGGETAATGALNGRKYNLVVKDKDGKVAANETVNVAFNEDIDGVISTVTSAEFVKVENGKQVGYEGKKITVKTNSKGEASFVISSNAVNSYATPIAWIDINNQSGKDANLDKGEPSAVAPISYFQAEYLDGSKLVSYKGTTETDKFDGAETATFKVQLTNQSGKVVANSGYTTKDVSYTVYNTGANDVKVGDVEIAPNRVYTVVAPNGEIIVTSKDGKSSSVKVLATGVAKETNGNKEFAFTSKEATATFTDTKEITNPYTGVLDLTSIDKKEEEIKFAGKTKAVTYAGEKGKTYKYYGIGNTTIADADAFIALLEDYASAGKTIRATYEVKDDVVTFTIISETAGTTPSDVVSKVNAATSAAQVTTALKGYALFEKLTAANKTTVANTIFGLITSGPITSAQLNAQIEALIVVEVTAVVTEGTTGVTGEKATGVYANATNTLTIESNAGETAYNDVKVVFEKNDVAGTTVTTSYDLKTKTLTVKLPVNVNGDVDAAATWNAVSTAIAADPQTVLTGTVAGFTGTDSASELVGKTIELKGATATTVNSSDKLVLTFSEAITTAPTALVFTGASTLGTTPAITLSADKKTVTITVDATNGNIVVGDTITALTGIAYGVTGQSVTFPIAITK